MTSEIGQQLMVWFLTRATDPVEKVAIVLWFSSNLTKGEAMQQAAHIMAGMTP